MFGDDFSGYGNDSQYGYGFDNAFYSSAGGVDDTNQDQLLYFLNNIIKEMGKKAKESFINSQSELRENKLFQEIAFFTIVFALKLALFISLRKGFEHGYTDL